MSANFLNKFRKFSQRLVQKRWIKAIVLPLWVVASFFLATYVLEVLIYIVVGLGVSFSNADATIIDALLAGLIYAFAIAIAIGVPWFLQRSKTTKNDIGMSRLPSWMDLLLSPAGFIVYFLGSAILVYIASQVVPGFSTDQVQQTGFSHLTHYYQYILAFITLIIVAPVAEEVLFRGYLFGKLRQFLPFWVAMLITSVLFGFVHGQWNVGVDVFALSMVLCSLREITGNIWAGMLLHMIKNGIAFYILFANPTF